ncbi:MAG: hypothetical protein HKO68_10215, partial [Desulfobacterales bacterium]|nr:hypothetical protein [Desulfobacterales bacterium]
DNTVAAGQAFMDIKPADAQGPAFLQALQSVDAPKLRLELYGSILKDVCQQAESITESAQVSLDELRLYFDSLQTAQTFSVHEALKHFPMDLVMKRFARIWAATDPVHVKMMRKAGSLIDLPLKMLLGAAGWAKDQLSTGKPHRPSSVEFAEKVDEDLVTAATGIHYQAVSPQISIGGSLDDPMAGRMVESINSIRARKKLAKTRNPQAEPSGEGSTITFLVDSHPAVFAEQEKLRARDFKAILQSILAEKNAIMDISLDMEKDLKITADHFRSKMGFWHMISQTFWALLNVLPATVAVTYVLSTGDPVGAAGIKIKLTGLFGAKDLYALFAIPVTTGLKKADRQQIEEMLTPIVQTWLTHKLKTVQDLFEVNITGKILQCARSNIDEAERLINDIQQLIASCAKGAGQ